MKYMWKGQSVEITPDATVRTFNGRITSFPEKIVSFSGSSYDELESDMLAVIAKFKEDPNQFPDKPCEMQVLDHFTKPRSMFRDFFSDEEIDSLKDIRFRERHYHPLYGVIKTFEETRNHAHKASFEVAYNTNNALKYIKMHAPELIKQYSGDLLNIENFENASSALAEIRAFGFLGLANLNPIRHEKGGENIRTPDFRFDSNGNKVLTEVHARISDEKDYVELSETEEITPDGYSIKTQITSVAPFGQPDPAKPNDGFTTNFISKICAAKGKEGQLKEETINILWLDLQDEITFGFSCEEDSFLPFYTHAFPNNYPLTGACWHAFYGKKGDDIIEFHDGFGFEKQKMGHDGRFYLNSKVNFAIIFIPERIVVYENPDSKRKAMPGLDSLRKSFYLMPKFSAEHSILEIYNGAIDALISHQRMAKSYCIKSFTDQITPEIVDINALCRR